MRGEAIAWGLLFSIPLWCAIIYLTTLITGCESIVPPPEQPPVVDTLPNNIVWLGASYGNAMPDGSVIRSASLDINKTYQDYTIADWPIGGQEPTLVQGIACFFREENGKLIGGKFEWMRKGVQPVKLTDNIHEGYNGHVFPAHGTPVYLLIVSVDGKHRTNMIEMDWR